MRVIAGTAKGTGLLAPRGSSTRPTADRVREALFSILGPVQGLSVLDLFAGSGALAIEALSRGAAQATLIDSDAAAIAAIRRNLEATGLGAQARRADALRFLQYARRAARQYDLVFLDPPYGRADQLAPQLSTSIEAVLAPHARVVAESAVRAPLLLALPMLDERRYGQTLIRIHGS